MIAAPLFAEEKIQPAEAFRSSSATRFTLDGDEKLERHLERISQAFLTGVREVVPADKLEALILGGGYGRGEGGVLRTETGDQPYNDLEFYVFIRGNRWLNGRRYRDGLHHLAHDLAATAKVEVEFKIISTDKLRRSSASMFYYDLVMGHRWLWGDESQLTGCAHHHEALLIPPAEATRLLMNRGSGLLFAREKLQHRPFTEADADFVGRNLAKAQLAFGDAILTAFGQYHWSCRQRHERLLKLVTKENLPWLPQARLHHAQGLEFKLHPHRTLASPATLQHQYEELAALGLQIWLWLESQRLGKLFVSARAYALSPLNKCPETNPWRNRLVNAMVFGPASIFRIEAGRYPRERLLNTLAILLWEKSELDPVLTRRLQNQLKVQTSAWGDFIVAYQSLSCRLNGSAPPSTSLSR
ncbi:MAG TPA: hypothetical protein VGR14_23925 [Verrucomicrobiae bacterium]|jgi:hypothetical protein|nr:hypothetical protein [Verrucomicrobiae bacterium]